MCNCNYDPVVGYRVDLVSGAELLAWSSVISEPPWARIDDAIAEAELLAKCLLLRQGLRADVRVAVVELSGDSAAPAPAVFHVEQKPLHVSQG